MQDTEQKLREALQAISHIDDDQLRTRIGNLIANATGAKP